MLSPKKRKKKIQLDFRIVWSRSSSDMSWNHEDLDDNIRSHNGRRQAGLTDHIHWPGWRLGRPLKKGPRLNIFTINSLLPIFRLKSIVNWLILKQKTPSIDWWQWGCNLSLVVLAGVKKKRKEEFIACHIAHIVVMCHSVWLKIYIYRRQRGKGNRYCYHSA